MQKQNVCGILGSKLKNLYAILELRYGNKQKCTLKKDTGLHITKC